MKICSLSLQNLKGTPNEDFYLIYKNNIFVVADGVSRLWNPDGSYPEPSGARLAAEVFCRVSIEYLKRHFKNANLKTLKNSFNFANRKIFELNERYGINKKLDYLRNDYFSTCGASAFIKNNILYYGYLGDCGIRIYNKDDLLKFISIDRVAFLEEWRDRQSFKSEKERWLTWRKILRNKPKAPYLTYGVFTGEPEVASYYYLGEIRVSRGDLIFLYSDGFLYFIKKPEFRELFRIYEGNQLFRKINNFVKKEMRSRSKIKNGEAILDDKTLISILI